MVYRDCLACRSSIHIDYYSTNQWSKGAGASRCEDCVAEGRSGPGRVRAKEIHVKDSARLNASTSATYETTAFAQGTFRWVHKGTYTSGPRRGEACVVKEFKSGSTMSETFFEKDIKAVDKTLQIVRAFNLQGVVSKDIVVNRPGVWTGCGDTNRGEKQLVEPFIRGFVKWNSNSGWTDEYSQWARVMQALSHFSYHVSSGQFVLCDLQGGLYDTGAVLTDPVIISRTKSYGITDLGPEGISNFFAHHDCNEYCRRSWTKPTQTRRTMNPVKGTTMQTVGTRHDLPPFSYGGPY